MNLFFLKLNLTFVFLVFANGALAAPNSVEDLVQQASQLNLANDIQWIKLLHYKNKFWGGVESEADGKPFFLAADGKTNPEAELAATLRGFYSTQSYEGLNQHPRCQFPARLLWLSKRLKIDEASMPPANCERFGKFKKALAAKSATLVFSSYYLNNPSSTFGHTFIRVNKTPHGTDRNRYELLDYGINYAAVATTSNAILYAAYGLTGVFPGTFTSIPYYYKVREYNDFESRDLWEYDLDLTADEIEMLVAHFWELGSTFFDYYYLTENCSYHMLTALEAAAPRLHVTEKIPFYVIPVDTVKAVAKEPGLMGNIRYRPSVRTVFDHRLKLLTPGERDVVEETVEKRDLALLNHIADPARKALVTDAVLDYVDFTLAKDLIQNKTEAQEWKQKLVSMRAAIPVITPELVVAMPENDKPHEGHETARLSLEHGWSNNGGNFLRPRQRFAMHDLLDPLKGYPEYAQIEFFDLRLRYGLESKTLWLDDWSLFRLVSISDIKQFNKRLSWRVKVSHVRVLDNVCDNCLAANFELGGGLAKTWVYAPRVTTYGLIETQTEASTQWSVPLLRLGVGPVLGLRVNLTDELGILYETSWKYFGTYGSYWVSKQSLSTRWSFTPQWAASLEGSQLPRSQELVVGLWHYY